MKSFCGVHQHQLVLLLAAAMATALDSPHNLASERSSIESTYELTKYLEYQLKEIKDIYLTYLGPPFNEKDFSPPRPNSTALSLPSAATNVTLWGRLENQARLTQNQKAYSVLLAAVRELARSTLCPSLKTSLLHFCTGLDGLLGSISALMTTLGYALPPPSTSMGSNVGELQYPQMGAGGYRPAPLVSQSLYRSKAGTRAESGQRNHQRLSGQRVVRGEREDSVTVDLVETRRAKEGRRADAAATEGRSGGSRGKGRGERGRRGRRGRREEPESGKWTASEEERVEKEEEEELEREEEGWKRRRLLSINEDDEEKVTQPEPKVEVSYTGTDGSSSLRRPAIQVNNNNNNNNNQYSYNLNSQHTDILRVEDGFIAERSTGLMVEEKQPDTEAPSSTFHHQRRPPRSLPPPTLTPPLSTLSLLYQFRTGEEHTLLSQPVPLSLQRGTSLLSPPLTPLLSSTSSASSPLLSVRPMMNDFARKVEGFWILRELQSWLWRSAKDFNRLKRRLAET